MHGFARMTEWELTKTSEKPDGSVQLHFNLPENVCAKNAWPAAKVDFTVTVHDKLTMELTVTNPSKEDFTFENCLHTYFEVGEIENISIAGLKGTSYLDKTENFARKLESGDSFKIFSETDRVFLDASWHGGNPRRKIATKNYYRKIRLEFDGGLESMDREGESAAGFWRHGIQSDDLCRIGQRGGK